eukprot:2023823-Rhodomonas_salina.5
MMFGRWRMRSAMTSCWSSECTSTITAAYGGQVRHALEHLLPTDESAARRSCVLPRLRALTRQHIILTGACNTDVWACGCQTAPSRRTLRARDGCRLEGGRPRTLAGPGGRCCQLMR